MKIIKARRSRTKIKAALAGPSGSGKTYSALLLAQGMTGDLSKVCLIDTENGSGHLYAQLGAYSVLRLDDHRPEMYIQALELASSGSFDVIVIDSISQCWEVLLKAHGEMSGNSFINWSKITPRYKSFLYAITKCPKHIVATMRTKQDYVLNPDANGRMIPEKVGLKYIQRDGIDYEFSLVFDLDRTHKAVCSKDRTGMFEDQPSQVLNEEIGRQILNWCEGAENEAEIVEAINNTTSIEELLKLFDDVGDKFTGLKGAFARRKKALLNMEGLVINRKRIGNGQQV